MANTEIDSLSLEIQIKGLDENKIKNLDKLSKAVSRLANTLKDADFSKLKGIKAPKGIDKINIISQNFNAGSLKDVDIDDSMSEAEERFEGFVETISSSAGELDENTAKIEKDAKIVGASAVGVAKGVKKAEEVINGKQAEKGGFAKSLEKLNGILKRIKLIAFIKAVRGRLNAIVKGIKEGITNLAGFDKEFNDTMSKLKTAWTTVSNSFGLMFRPIIETIQPVITQISQAVATLGNEISRIQATMKGASTYTKVSAKYMDDFAKSSQKATLFSFDTFNTLNTDDSSSMFETASVDEEDTENTSALAEAIAQIQELLSNVMELLKVILKFAVNLINKLLPALNVIMKFVNYLLQTITPLIDGILEALDPLLDAILVDLLPTLLEIVSSILTPILNIVRILTPIISKIVELVASVLAPVIKLIAVLIEPFVPMIDLVLDIITGIVELITIDLKFALNMIGDLLIPIIESFKIVTEQFQIIGDIIKDLFTGDFQKLGEDIGRFFKNLFFNIVRVIASVLDAVINLFVDAINWIADGFNWVFEKLGWDWHWGISWRSNLADQVPRFENGGIVGEVWQMNEHGVPEMLYNANNSGNTAVINQAQLSLAFENAIYNTGLLDAIAKAGVINIDGKYVAQSQNFKNEINRTNPGLNIR